VNEIKDGEGKRPPKLDCPPSWLLVSLKSIAEVQLGKTPSKTDYRDSGPFKIVKYRDLGDDRTITWTNCSKGFIEVLRARSLNLRALKLNDVLISASAHSSEIIGRKVLHVIHIPEEFEFAYFVGEILCIRIASQLTPSLSRLLTYFFQSINGYRSIQSKVHGVHLVASRAEEMLVPLAPIAAQSRIVSKIDELFSEIEEGERALERVQKLVHRYRQSVVKAAVTGELTREWRGKHKGKLGSGEALLARILKARREAWEHSELEKMKAKGQKPTNNNWKTKYKDPTPPNTANLPELPEGWVWASVDQLSILITSGSRGWKEHYSKSGSMFIRAQNLKYDVLSLDDVAFVNLESVTEGLRTRVAVNDLLVTITGANVTKSALVKIDLPEAYVSQHVALVRPALCECSRFLFLWIISAANGRRQLLDAAYGAGKPGLSLEDLKQVTVALPCLEEQEAICDAVDVETERLAHLTGEFDSIKPDVLRQTLLRSAFSGQLVPEDPTDEPASILLERIATERNQQRSNASPKATRRKKVTA
jgi:type I restriction enzyme S subunit